MRKETTRALRLMAGGAALALVLGVFNAPSAEAIPAFARKYGTSCQTCHVAFPKLTPFGEAFRRNGYRFPAGEEEDASEDEPLALGQKAHEKVWPDAVWPSVIPGMVPLSLQLGSDMIITPEGDPKANFGNLGGRAVVNYAGTLGPRLSAWAGFGVGVAPGEAGKEVTEAELERIFIVYQVFTDQPHLNLRLGRFELGATPFTVHRTFGPAPWISTTPVKDNPFSLDPAHLGIEATGVAPGGRLAYAAGYVSGVGHQSHAPQDFYGRLEYKLGGMRLDGIGGATDSQPWRETSVKLGAFGYAGNAPLGDPEMATQDDRFWIAGGDLTLHWRDLNLMGAYAVQRNDRPSLAEPMEETESWFVFSQADYVVYPWLIPSIRYEHKSVAGESADRIAPSVYVLIYANVRALAQASIERPEGGHFEVARAVASLRLAF